MADFSTLYGDRLDRELGSKDRTVLFTTQRRKDAINEAQLEFTEQTACLRRSGTISVVDGQDEYELEAAFSDFGWPVAEGPTLTIDTAVAQRSLAGDDLPRHDLTWLNRFRAGWRQDSGGVPELHYLRSEGGKRYLGLYPTPTVNAGETWTLSVPYVAQPAALVNDADVPFVTASDPPLGLVPYHQALVHFAAAQLEKLRRDQAASDLQLQRFATYVARYLQRATRPGGNQVTYARDYYGDVRRVRHAGIVYGDPYR